MTEQVLMGLLRARIWMELTLAEIAQLLGVVDAQAAEIAALREQAARIATALVAYEHLERERDRDRWFDHYDANAASFRLVKARHAVTDEDRALAREIPVGEDDDVWGCK